VLVKLVDLENKASGWPSFVQLLHISWM